MVVIKVDSFYVELVVIVCIFQYFDYIILVVFAVADAVFSRELCPNGHTINCHQIDIAPCPPYTSGRPPNCVRIKCPFGWAGSFEPYCTEKPPCPTDRPVGVWPHCKRREKCPLNTIGHYPFCECAPGTIGEWPKCTIAVPSLELQPPHREYLPPDLPSQVPSLIGYLPPTKSPTAPIHIVGYIPPTTLQPNLLGYLPPDKPSAVYLPPHIS